METTTKYIRLFIKRNAGASSAFLDVTWKGEKRKKKKQAKRE